MTLTNHISDQQHLATSLRVSDSPVEWMPLDDLIQSWASFASEATNAACLFATSAAFAALACESSARASYLEAEDRCSRLSLSWSPRIQADRMEALTQLSTACHHWLMVEPHLARCTLAHDFANGMIPDLVYGLSVHEVYLFRLFLRVLEETATKSREPLQILVGFLHAADLEVRQ